MRWAGNLDSTEGMQNAYNFQTESLKGREYLLDLELDGW